MTFNSNNYAKALALTSSYLHQEPKQLLFPLSTAKGCTMKQFLLTLVSFGEERFDLMSKSKVLDLEGPEIHDSNEFQSLNLMGWIVTTMSWRCLDR